VAAGERTGRRALSKAVARYVGFADHYVRLREIAAEHANAVRARWCTRRPRLAVR
jgi:hypothetical protein